MKFGHFLHDFEDEEQPSGVGTRPQCEEISLCAIIRAGLRKVLVCDGRLIAWVASYVVPVASLLPWFEEVPVGMRVGRVVNAMITAPSRQTPPAIMKGVIQTAG